MERSRSAESVAVHDLTKLLGLENLTNRAHRPPIKLKDRCDVISLECGVRGRIIQRYLVEIIDVLICPFEHCPERRHCAKAEEVHLQKALTLGVVLVEGYDVSIYVTDLLVINRCHA